MIIRPKIASLPVLARFRNTYQVQRARDAPRSSHTFHNSSANRSGHSYNSEHTIPEFHVRRQLDKAQEQATATAKWGASAHEIPTPGDGLMLRRRKDPAHDQQQQTAAVGERVEEEADLARFRGAQTRLREGKVPFEVEGTDGIVVHPSGFIPPTTAKEFSQAPPEEHRKVRAKETTDSGPTSSSGKEDKNSASTSALKDASSPSPSGTSSCSTLAEPNPRSTETDPSLASPTDVQSLARQRQAIQERKEQEGGLVSELTAGILTGGVSASTEPGQEKIPREFPVDGEEEMTTQHPSGFVPPNPHLKRV